MSQVQTYRAELADRQSRHFLGYLGLACGLHLLGAAVLVFWQPRLLNPQAAESPLPLEFVYVEPQTKPQTAPPQAQRRAQTNSTAGGTRDSARPVQAAPRPDSPAVRSIPAQSAAQLQPRAQPVPPAPEAAPAAPPASPLAIARTIPSPAPSPALSPASNSASSRLSARPDATTTAPRLAAQLGNHSVSVEQGGAAQLNPDRTATGAGVDAAQDNVWGGYLAALNRAVERHWRQVSITATSRTRVQFRVDRQGRLISLQVLEGSGDRLADQAAIQAVRAAAPFAPLPQNATEDVLIVSFTFTQWLNPGSP